MFNLKWGIFPAAAAFILAFLLSLLIGHASFLNALLRALIFAAIFFALGAGFWIIIKTFLPELLTPQSRAEPVTNIFSIEQPGSRVNITLDESTHANDVSNAALPSGGSIDEVENISHLVSGTFRPSVKSRDIDQNPFSGYTEEASEPASMDEGSTAKSDSNFGDFFSDFSSFIPETGGDSFSPSLGNESYTEPVSETPAKRRNSGSKPVKMEGDFNPKEIAAGIRTVLEKDKRG